MLLRILTVFLSGLLCLTVAQAQDAGARSVLIRSVQADFVQEKHLAILAHPIVSTGRFTFKAPVSLRWEYFTPVHTVLLMDDGRTRKYVSQNGEFVEEHGMGVDSMQIVLQEITGWLDGEINDTPTFIAEPEKDGYIILRPRDQALARIVSRIELKLMGTSGLMESVTLYEGPESFTRMVFAEAVLNEAILPSVFRQP